MFVFHGKGDNTNMQTELRGAPDLHDAPHFGSPGQSSNLGFVGEHPAPHCPCRAVLQASRERVRLQIPSGWMDFDKFLPIWGGRGGCAGCRLDHGLELN